MTRGGDKDNGSLFSGVFIAHHVSTDNVPVMPVPGSCDASGINDMYKISAEGNTIYFIFPKK
jgi:hypothetical protein